MLVGPLQTKWMLTSSGVNEGGRSIDVSLSDGQQVSRLLNDLGVLKEGARSVLWCGGEVKIVCTLLVLSTYILCLQCIEVYLFGKCRSRLCWGRNTCSKDSSLVRMEYPERGR